MDRACGLRQCRSKRTRAEDPDAWSFPRARMGLTFSVLRLSLLGSRLNPGEFYAHAFPDSIRELQRIPIGQPHAPMGFGLAHFAGLWGPVNAVAFR